MSRRFLIFDLDGTLIDSSEGVIEATNYALTKLGEPIRTAAEIRRYIGFPLEEMFADFSAAPYEELRSHFQHRARETVVSSSTALPGVENVIVRLHESGYVMAIATTKISVHIRLILDKLGWRDYFSATVGGDEVSKVKPAPEAFQKALGMMYGQPENTMVIGDTINDVLAARAAGLVATAVRSPFGGSEELAEARPTYIIDSIESLPAVLEHHFTQEV